MHVSSEISLENGWIPPEKLKKSNSFILCWAFCKIFSDERRDIYLVINTLCKKTLKMYYQMCGNKYKERFEGAICTNTCMHIEWHIHPSATQHLFSFSALRCWLHTNVFTQSQEIKTTNKHGSCDIKWNDRYLDLTYNS